jgi:hypothetical protein
MCGRASAKRASTEAEAVNCVVDAPEFPERERLTTGRKHALCPESTDARLVKALDVSEHLTRAPSDAPQLIVQLNEGDTEAIDSVM